MLQYLNLVLVFIYIRTDSKKIKYHWVIDGKLYAKSKSILFSDLYQWNGVKWKSADIKIPVYEQSILLSDDKFIVYRKCSGEFGGTIYFFDRQSKETYFTESTCANTVIKKKRTIPNTCTFRSYDGNIGN